MLACCTSTCAAAPARCCGEKTKVSTRRYLGCARRAMHPRMHTEMLHYGRFVPRCFPTSRGSLNLEGSPLQHRFHAVGSFLRVPGPDMGPRGAFALERPRWGRHRVDAALSRVFYYVRGPRKQVCHPESFSDGPGARRRPPHAEQITRQLAAWAPPPAQTASINRA